MSLLLQGRESLQQTIISQTLSQTIAERNAAASTEKPRAFVGQKTVLSCKAKVI